ncbi:MAG: ABC transporter ATP-binding protein [Amaricoccus sp.]|uniref:ABC transporter ATP-binding protein n=1 Tax=Amaricoccus sp. TaxID=1872485 RepID=UPI0039E66E18
MTAPSVLLSGKATVDGAVLFGPLDVELAAGQWTCLLGPSGVGKSTVLRLIAGLPTGVRFEGAIAADDGVPLAGRVGYMAQSDLLLPWLDVRGNVLLGARLRREAPDVARAEALVARVGLAARAGRRPRTLSGGERQRAALARTLMEDRPVVLLDEPFSALDAGTRAAMQETAAELLAGRTVLLVTHDPGEAARLGHRILVMTATGVTVADPPAAPATDARKDGTPPIRAHDDPGTLACQARLLTLLRRTA